MSKIGLDDLTLEVGANGHVHITNFAPTHSRHGDILQDALRIINGERKTQYGDAEDSFTSIANYWTQYLHSRGWDKAERLRPQDVAMMMTLLKIAREANQHKKDNLVDAAGYIGLAGDME